MITLFRAYGNNSNRLFQNIHFEAYCIEHGIEFRNPSFADLGGYYACPSRTDGSVVSRLLGRLPFQLLRRLPLRNVVLFDGQYSGSAGIARLRADRDSHVAGWDFRVHDLTAKHHETLAPRYALKDEYFRENPLYQYAKQVDRSKRLLVGIHVRRGDYKFFYDGKYYFDDAVYKNCMTMMEREADKIGKSVEFLIFSNEAVDIPEGPSVRISCNPWYVDQHLMSLCDCLVGPPSTFTLWASYVGGARYCHIETAAQSITLDAFRLCQG